MDIDNWEICDLFSKKKSHKNPKLSKYPVARNYISTGCIKKQQIFEITQRSEFAWFSSNCVNANERILCTGFNCNVQCVSFTTVYYYVLEYGPHYSNLLEERNQNFFYNPKSIKSCRGNGILIRSDCYTNYRVAVLLIYPVHPSTKLSANMLNILTGCKY